MRSHTNREREDPAMQILIDRAGMQKSDRDCIAAGTSGQVLMRRAAEAILAAYPFHGRVGILAGEGNNGGDGYACAWLLASRGVVPVILSFAPPRTADAAYYDRLCQQENIAHISLHDAIDFSCFDALIDCLYGIGYHPPMEEKTAEVIRRVNASGVPVISADIPSGLTADGGQGDPVICAYTTVAVGCAKLGHYLGQGKDCVGRLISADIGIPLTVDGFPLLEDDDVKAVFTPRKHASHKGTYGTVTVIGGCVRYPGAPRLSVMAASAMRAGTGVVRLAVGESLCSVLTPLLLESTLFPLRERDGELACSEKELADAVHGADTVAVGMGWGRGQGQKDVLSYLFSHYTGTLVIDADGLNALSGTDLLTRPRTPSHIVLTPHPAEFARLSHLTTADVLSSPVSHATAFARRHHVIVLLKGATTVVTDGETTYLSSRGCPGMATAGSGDVLTGVVAALVSYLPCTPLTVACASYLTGTAGEMAQSETGDAPMIASDTVAHLPAAYLAITQA